MPRFHVRVGSLQVTILADDPQEAALESLQGWGDGWGDDGEAHHRRHLAEQVVVTETESGGPAERFVTFDLLARLNRETSDAAWRRVLAGFDPNNN